MNPVFVDRVRRFSLDVDEETGRTFVSIPVRNQMAEYDELPGWEGDIAQVSSPMPPYSSQNHMGQCGMVNVFTANYDSAPAGSDPNAAQFVTPSYTWLTPVDERGASNDVLNNTPCVAPGSETRCLGNLAQSCATVGGKNVFRTAQDCGTSSSGGNFVQMCRQSTGTCCTPGRENTCQ